MNVIEAKNLTKEYESKKGIHDISLNVQSGECFGILGHNGAGKTTLVETMLGLRKWNDGNVSIMSHDMSKRDKTLFEDIGVQLQQSFYEEKIKVKELCEERAVLYKKDINYDQLLELFSLSDKKNQLVELLSGGEKQRLSILLAIMHQPQLVFLDELTTGLDAVARREIWRYLLKLKENGLSIVLTSHYMDEVEVLCDRIMILSDGKELVSGTVQEVIDKSPYDSMENAFLWYMGEDELI